MQKPKILLVNDNTRGLLALKTLLTNSPQADDYDVLTAASHAEALRAVLCHRLALVLLDLRMSGLDGVETARSLHAQPDSSSIPIVFITGSAPEKTNLLVEYCHGTVDYLVSPLLPQLLHSKVAVFVDLARKSRQLELQKEELALLSRDAQLGETRDLKRIAAALESEILERRQAEARAHDLATRDSLTGLMNRGSLTSRLEHAIAMSNRCGQRLALLFLDIDRFKSINDSLGHDAGDDLLRQVTERLSGAVRRSDTIARLGGDEFVVLMESLPNYTSAAEVARKIVGALAAPFQLGTHQVKTTASIGIGLFPQDGGNGRELMRSANLAMYHAKQERCGSIQFFQEEFNARMVERFRLERELQHALDNDEFELYYQPKIDARTGCMAGVEALLRWHHPRLGLLSGGQFIQAASETGMLVSIGEWVIAAACAQARRWRDEDVPARAIPIAVNVAIPQIYADLPQIIGRELRRQQVPPSAIQLEITESLVITDTAKATSVLREISESGITIAIDDFGTGYSSLSVLKTLPVDVLKIDQSFVRDLGRNASDNAIVAAIVNMARALALRVVAEGVETEEQLAVLHELGCDEHQGYFYSKPLPAEELVRTLMERS